VPFVRFRGCDIVSVLHQVHAGIGGCDSQQAASVEVPIDATATTVALIIPTAAKAPTAAQTAKFCSSNDNCGAKEYCPLCANALPICTALPKEGEACGKKCLSNK